MEVRFTRQAEADIIDGYVYGAINFGRARAERYEADLRRAIGLIGDNPRLAAERSEYAPPVRIHHHGRHDIVYRIVSRRIMS